MYTGTGEAITVTHRDYKSTHSLRRERSHSSSEPLVRMVGNPELSRPATGEGETTGMVLRCRVRQLLWVQTQFFCELFSF
jgi:hypothetical protein